jgi:hypothetical protein
MNKYLLPSIAMLGVGIGSFLLENYMSTQNGLVKLFLMLIGFFVLFFFVREYKLKTLNGFGSFGELFKFGFFIVLISGVIASVFLFVYLNYIDGHILAMNELALEEAKETMLDKQGEVPKEVDNVFKTMNSPGVFSVLFLIGNLFWGTVYSLISAAIQKNSSREQFVE